jgi:hypothetical protein
LSILVAILVAILAAILAATLGFTGRLRGTGVASHQCGQNENQSVDSKDRFFH